jgi:hypothetical protein
LIFQDSKTCDNLKVNPKPIFSKGFKRLSFFLQKIYKVQLTNCVLKIIIQNEPPEKAFKLESFLKQLFSINPCYNSNIEEKFTWFHPYFILGNKDALIVCQEKYLYCLKVLD